MAQAERGERGWKSLRGLRPMRGARKPRRSSLASARRARWRASDFEHGKSRSGWWEWGETKQALEWLFWSGQITTATRRGSFERVYDLTERVIPAAILALPTPSAADAHRRAGRARRPRPGRRHHGGPARLFPARASRTIAARSRAWSRRAVCCPSRSRAGASRPFSTPRRATRAASRARPCSPPSIP